MKKYTEEQRKVMHAWVEGAEIECRCIISERKEFKTFAPISDDKIPAWDWKDFEYRIKPEPLGIGILWHCDKINTLLICTYSVYEKEALNQHYSHSHWQTLESLGLTIKE